MKITREHDMTREKARTTVESLIPDLIDSFGQQVSDPRWDWRGDVMTFSFTAMGLGIEGTLEVSDSTLVLDVKLPLLARAFEGKLVSVAEREIDRYLSSEGDIGTG